ncbi:MAG: metallophosphoesterase, partial [Candidatus Bathyarchaeota archaeon]
MTNGFLKSERRRPGFRYAVLSDTHIRPEGDESSSPWRVNLYTNDRARWVIDRINRSAPDFIVHMGDIVHPLPHLPTYGSAAESALSILSGLKAPCHCIPGNHDVGDKKNPTVPAYVVDDHGLDLYRKWFGPLYRSFDHGGVHFVLINAQALNSGLAHEDEHSKWLVADLEEKKGERIHMFSHYPPYILEPSEPSNYDNLDEPARSWLLKLLKRYGVEALFAGHAHQFFYQKHDTTDIYNVFSTSFVRQDYSEMFRVEAAEEHGRNDAEKLGWCIVDVYEDTHVARMFRSHGHTLRKGEKALPENPKVNAYHTNDGLASFLVVHLRHHWAEIIELPYNGPVDEFVRKRVRNDYTLLGLWECGIRKLRVPLRDLIE